MSLDARARRAAGDFRQAVAEMDRTADDSRSFERFELYRRRTERRRTAGAVIVAAIVAVAGVALVGRAIEGKEPAVVPPPDGLILYGVREPRVGHPEIGPAHWFTVRPDGTELTDLGVIADCAVWFPDGSRILISTEAGPSALARPAVIDPDGSGLRPLDAAQEPHIDFGCGDVAPDGGQIVIDGYGLAGRHGLDGMYAMAADGGGEVVRLLAGHVGPPDHSPDGSQVTFTRAVPGANANGPGALFVMGTDGTGLERITPQGSVFGRPDWSPDGSWIVFERPFGRLFVVHPDGTGLHEVPIELPGGAGAQEPSWSPNGSMIVFSALGTEAGIYTIRVDGTDMRRVSFVSQPQSPSWGPGTG
jgi:hypothetical protein